MNLYKRDYLKDPTENEKITYKKICEEEKKDTLIGKKNLYDKYPEAVRHHNSLFPNNHIELSDWKSSGKMDELTNEFEQLVHSPDANEQQILNFINHKPAYYIIGSLLSYKDFGHHETYIFPEFSIGNRKYRADYLIIGKNSGGYEFLFVELEAPNKRTTIKSGYGGQNMRSGLNQTSDWKYEIESNFESITNELKKHCSYNKKLPKEFVKYDSSRMHFMVICGLRDDYSETTYRERRIKIKENGIDLYHYDNLIDFTRSLGKKITF